ncbi:hypothetical protein M8J77_003749 [Diaphorina citri]|nr:hypothetical protein M8J77_003749 [Diaphorina citri]
MLIKPLISQGPENNLYIASFCSVIFQQNNHGHLSHSLGNKLVLWSRRSTGESQERGCVAFCGVYSSHLILSNVVPVVKAVCVSWNSFLCLLSSKCKTCPRLESNPAACKKRPPINRPVNSTLPV